MSALAIERHAPEIRRASMRGRQQAGWLDAHFSFSFAGWHAPGRDGFGDLLVLNEDRIAPASGFPMHPHRDVEILMLPLAGAIAHEDSLGHRFTVGPGDVVHMRAGSGIRHSQHNASDVAIDHHLQVWLRPRTRGLRPATVRRAFGAADRQDRWQLLASGDGSAGSLSIDVAGWVWRATVERRPLDYVPASGRSLYLHVAAGEVALALDGTGDSHALAAGDAAAWHRSARVRLLPVRGSRADVLLFDLPPVR